MKPFSRLTKTIVTLSLAGAMAVLPVTFSARADVTMFPDVGEVPDARVLEEPFMRMTDDFAEADAIGGYTLADKLSPREFAELLKIDYETAKFLYSAYAVKGETYDKLISGIAKYRVPLIDMLLYISDKVDEGYITLEGDQADTLAEARAKMLMGKQQLEGTDFDRMLVYLTLPEAGDETYRFTDTIRDVAQSHYPKGQVYVVGNSTNQYEFEKSFQIDNIVVSVVSILIVLVQIIQWIGDRRARHLTH